MTNFSTALERTRTGEKTSQAVLLSQVDENIQSLAYKLPQLEKSWMIRDLDAVLRRLHWTRAKYRKVKMMSLIIGILASFGIILLSGLPFLGLWSFLIITIAIGSSWFLPDQYLLDAQSTQKVQLHAQVPDFLQLFALSVSSSGYISLAQVLEDISKALTGSLRQEIDHILRKKQFLDNAELLEELTALTDHQFLQDLGMILQIHQSYGGQLSDALIDLAHRAQTDRVQHATELANASSGLLLGPLLIFHLPALLIIVLIPAVLAFSNGI